MGGRGWKGGERKLLLLGGARERIFTDMGERKHA